MKEITLDEKCNFCHGIITERERRAGLELKSSFGHIAHRDCLEYVMHKYPNVPITELEGKINRTRVELTTLKDQILHEDFQKRQNYFQTNDGQNKSLFEKYKPNNPFGADKMRNGII